MADREQLELAIAAQERLRGVVADEVIDLTIASLRERLDVLAVSRQRRRHATVLFADVQGFTSVAETTDPEVLSGIMNELWARIDSVISANGGRIDKHLGDAVMAVWGAESSGEDDPERAVRAGLELQRALTVDNEQSGRELAMRVGITTGPVLLGEIGSTREFTAMGDTVNVAARLEQLAPVGGVLISHDTYRHVRGVFDVAPQGPITVRGRAGPVGMYIVHHAKPQTFRIPSRGVEGVETRMVGRDQELEALKAAFEGVAARTGSVVITLIGEAGIGKSRLLYELESWIELSPTRVYYFKARALSTRQPVPYGVIRDLLCSRFQIGESDAPALVAEKLADGFAGHLSVAESELLGHWLGFDVPSLGSARTPWNTQGSSTVCAAHFAHFLRSVASSQPVLIVLEDLHWADDESLDLLEDLLGRVHDTPVLVVGAARGGLLDRRSDWLATCPAATRHELLPLSEDASRTLVHDVIRVAGAVPDEVAELIVRRAEGNPFFVEELIKMLIDDGVIVIGDAGEPWEVDLSRLVPATVPATLTGVLEARLDTLQASQRDALQRASVVGRVFWDAAVSALAPTRSAMETTDALEAARERELIFYSERPSLTVSTEYVFKHALLRDVTYETVLLRDRKQLHGLVADWLAANAGERLGELLEVIAEHRALSGDAETAADLFHTSARRALDAGRSQSAKRLVERAIELWSSTSADPPPEATLVLADSCCRRGEFDQANAALGRLPNAPLSPAIEAEALYLSSWITAERGDHEHERALLVQALPLAESVGGPVLIHVLLGLTWLESGIGDLDEAERRARLALSLAEETGEATEIGRGFNALGAVLSLRDDIDGSAWCAERALAVARSIGDLEGEAVARGNLAVSAHLRGDASGELLQYEQAAEQYRAQLALTQRLGLEQASLNAHLNLAQVSIRLDRAADAQVCLDEALSGLAVERTRSQALFAVIVQADLLLHLGDIDHTLTMLGAALRDWSASEIDRQEIERVIARSDLSAAAVEAGMRLGEHRDIGDLVDELRTARHDDPIR